jgi:lysyl endopeptidase
MLRKLLSISLFLGFFHLVAFTQQTTLLQRNFQLLKSTPTLIMQTPNMEEIHHEDEVNDRNGMLYRIGVHAYTQITAENYGNWTVDQNGNTIWQLHVKFDGAEALSFLFQTFKIYGGTTVDVFDNAGKALHKTLTSADVLDHFQQNMALCFGDEMTLQIKEPAGTIKSEILIDRIVYNYRSTGNPNVPKINESDECEVNVNCSPVGNNWQDEKRGVARIYVVDSQGAGWCTGSLVNNTSLNCKPYFLTALHCGISTSASNSNLWRFYFRYESPNCTNPTSAGTLDDHYITGCVRLANSNDAGGDSGSDFLLVQLGSLANESTTITTLKSGDFNAYWNGWDANNSTVSSAVGIHHPAGDIKKISTSGPTSSTSWGGTVANTHWMLAWLSNTNGYGVTEGGSSGSPLFNQSGRIIGTLTGGSSTCADQDHPDAYGKMSFHWTQNGTPANERLKTYLDPTNTGALVFDGSSNPCAVGNVAPIADFVANPTTVSVGGTSQFTDLSSNSPTNWTWSISPGTGWSYSGGTNANSQNPQVTFTTSGVYTVSLTASNPAGSDTETKTDYITVTLVTSPCTGSSTYCEEFIANITTGTINNSTACTNYTMYPGGSFTKGQEYNLYFLPQVGSTPGNAYYDDEFAAWIDFNGDFDFDDQGEQIAYSIASASGFTNNFTYTIPMTAVVGNVYMRCRLHYSGSDIGEGPIMPCGNSSYGEVEDYLINITAPSSSSISLTCGDMQTIYGSSGVTTVPDVTDDATAQTNCSSGGLVLTQNPVAGTQLNNGANVITVTATDNCGNSQTCTTVINYINDMGIAEGIFDNIKVYPIPVEEILTVDLSSFTGSAIHLELLDITGKLIYSFMNVPKEITKIDLSAVAKGSYQLRLNSGSHSRTVRVVKL